jgi:hypothetical protein
MQKRQGIQVPFFSININVKNHCTLGVRAMPSGGRATKTISMDEVAVYNGNH